VTKFRESGTKRKQKAWRQISIRARCWKNLVLTWHRRTLIVATVHLDGAMAFEREGTGVALLR
jgi:hypothetical protein